MADTTTLKLTRMSPEFVRLLKSGAALAGQNLTEYCSELMKQAIAQRSGTRKTGPR